MDSRRKKDEKKILIDTYNTKAIHMVASLPHLLYRNNDFLYGKRCKEFEWAISLFKECSNNARQELYDDINFEPFDYYHLVLYMSLINKTINFIKENIEDDNLSRYAFLQSLFRNNCFSGGVSNPSPKHVDYTHLNGVDVVLGNGCCRHKASLLKSVLSYFTDTLEIDVGREENRIPNHAIISFYDRNRQLFLNSVNPCVYVPIDDCRLIDSVGINYIKTVPTFVTNENFQEVSEYYKFFQDLIKRSRIPNFESLHNEIWDKYIAYNMNTEMLEEFKKRIQHEQKEIKLSLKR